MSRTSFVNLHNIFNSTSFEPFRTYRPQPDVKPPETAACICGCMDCKCAVCIGVAPTPSLPHLLMCFVRGTMCAQMHSHLCFLFNCVCCQPVLSAWAEHYGALAHLLSWMLRWACLCDIRREIPISWLLQQKFLVVPAQSTEWQCSVRDKLQSTVMSTYNCTLGGRNQKIQK